MDGLQASNGAITLAMLIQLNDLQIDKLIFILTNLPPHTNLRDVKCRCLRDIILLIREETERRGNRYTKLTETFDNLEEIADILGWDADEWDWYKPIVKAAASKATAKAKDAAAVGGIDMQQDMFYYF